MARMASGILVCFFANSARATEVLIDFETLPGGGTPVLYSPVADSYAAWGVSFIEEGFGTSQPAFTQGYGGDGSFAWTGQSVYPPGHNIAANFNVPTFEVSADVMTCPSPGEQVTMVAKDANGAILSSVTSDGPSTQFWKGTIAITSIEPIARVEWWPITNTCSVGIDNLEFSDSPPEPIPAVSEWGMITLSLLILTAGTLVYRHRNPTIQAA